MQFKFIPSHPIPSFPIPSHPIPSHLIPSHPNQRPSNFLFLFISSRFSIDSLSMITSTCLLGGYLLHSSLSSVPSYLNPDSFPQKKKPIPIPNVSSVPLKPRIVTDLSNINHNTFTKFVQEQWTEFSINLFVLFSIQHSDVCAQHNN